MLRSLLNPEFESVTTQKKLFVPTYDSKSAAPDVSDLLYKIPPSGSDTSGLYHYDPSNGHQLLDESGGVSAGDLSKLTIDTDKDWSNYVITGMGHDGVRVPQARDLTVADFEGGTFPQDAVGNVADASVQTGTVLEGSYTLELSSGSSGASNVGFTARRNVPQMGDEFEVKFYLTDQEDVLRVAVFAEDPSVRPFRTTSLDIRVRTDKEQIRVNQHIDGTKEKYERAGIPFSNHLNEVLTLNATTTGKRDYDITILDSGESEIGNITGTIVDKMPKAGNVIFEAANSSVGYSQFFDGFTTKRREPEARVETKKGTTQLGNEVTPSGTINTGPLEAPPDHPNYPVLNLPVTDDMAQGDQVGYHLAIDEQSALTVEAEADGNGGVQNRQVRSHDPLTTDDLTNGDQTFNEGASMVHDRDEVTNDQSSDGSGYYLVDTGAAGKAVTLTLASADAEEGREVNIKRDGIHDVTVETEGSETIDGANSIALKADQEAVTLVHNNSDSEWEVW